MDQPRRGGGCARADVALFQKDHPQAASRGVARNADAVQAADDDRKIVVRHARTIAFSREVDTGSREEKASSKKRRFVSATNSSQSCARTPPYRRRSGQPPRRTVRSAALCR